MNGNMLLSPDALHCLKRKQLTNLCRRFGIKAVGKNADLIQRLQEYAASNIPTDSPTKGNVPILRHVKRPRQSDSSHESANDDPPSPIAATLSYPPLTPRTRQKRVSDLVAAIEQVKEQDDGMDTDEDDEEGALMSQRNTIVFPASSPAPMRRPLLPPVPAAMPEQADTTQPLRIIKALPSSNRLASPLSTATILEMSRTAAATDGNSSLYPDLSTLPLPQGVSSDCLTSSSTLPSITSRQFSAAAASVLAEMNARLTAAGRSTTSGSLATMSSIGNGTWQNLAASASSQGMSKSRSGRYEIHHERQFKKMDSIVTHYAARRVGAGVAAASTVKSADTGKSSNRTGSDSDSGVAASSVPATRMTASTSTSRRPRVDASTSTRSLAAMTRSTSARKAPVQRRPLPTPPVSSARSPPPPTPSMLPASTTRAQIVQLRNASINTTTTTSSANTRSNDPPRAKRLRLAVSEDQDALQNTVLEIPPEKKTVVIRVTRPEREGMPYKFSLASAAEGGESAPTRAASSLRKTVIKATKGTFVGSSSARKMATGAQSQKREAAFVKQQQQQAAMSRSLSSRADLASAGQSGMAASTTSTRNRFTGVTTMATATTPSRPVAASGDDARKPSVAVSAMSGATEASKHSSISSRFGGSIRSSVSQGLGRAEMARQARLKEIKARTKAALAGFGSQRNVSSATSSTNMIDSLSPHKPLPPLPSTPFSESVMRPTIASLGRSTATPSTASNASASLPVLSNIAPASSPSSTFRYFEGAVAANLERAATIHAGVGKALAPCLTPRSSSLRHLRRVMRKQQKQADLEHVRIAAAENIAPGDVVPSVVTKSTLHPPPSLAHHASIRTVATAASPVKPLTTSKTLNTPRSMTARPAGPRAALVASRATTSALSRF